MSHTLLLATAVVALLGLSLDQRASPRVPAKDITDPDAYSVYRAVIPHEWPVRVANAKRLVIAREAATYDQCLPTGPPMGAEWRPVLENYKAENEGVRHLLADRDLGIPYIVQPLEELNAFFTPPAGNFERGWSNFYRRYPDSGGYMEVSAVGFNTTKTRALVYVSHHCGGLCGGGSHHLLEKGDGGWQRANLKDVKMCIWMS